LGWESAGPMMEPMKELGPKETGLTGELEMMK
jgi:hypothetical protein